MREPIAPDDLARIEEVDAQTREAAALYLWDEGIVRPESLARQVIDALVIDGWRPSGPALVAGVRSLQARITELEAVIAEAPHGQKCDWWHAIPCDCWKSRYRAGADHE